MTFFCRPRGAQILKRSEEKRTRHGCRSCGGFDLALGRGSGQGARFGAYYNFAGFPIMVARAGHLFYRKAPRGVAWLQRCRRNWTTYSSRMSCAIALPTRLTISAKNWHSIARQMAEQPDQVLPRLVRLAMDLCRGQSAGISLYEAQPPGPGIFRWHHLAGRYANFLGGTAPRDFSPSGVCLDVGHPILMARPERVYSFLSEAVAPNCEVLIVPLNAGQPDPWARFGSFHTTRQFISTAATTGDNRARGVCRPRSQDDPGRFRVAG
jgi:hypothetical protein